MTPLVPSDGMHRLLVIDERGHPSVRIVDDLPLEPGEVEIDVSEFDAPRTTTSRIDEALLAELLEETRSTPDGRCRGGGAVSERAVTGAPTPRKDLK